MHLNTSKRIPLLPAAFALSSVALLYFFLFPLYSQYFPKCLFHSLTGLYCPGCGSQRALTALLHLNIVSAAHDNLLAVIAIPFFCYALKLYFFDKETKKRQSIFYSPIFVKVVLIAVILFSIARNIPFHPFALLAPLN